MNTEEETKSEMIDFEPIILKFIEDQETWKLISDENYNPIIVILRQGHKTVDEIHREYNRLWKVNHPEKKPKSKKTIYYYLGELEKKGIVIKSGQRMVKGKTAVEKLYSRTAVMFYFLGTHNWEKKENDKIVESYRQVLGLLTNKPAPTTEQTINFLQKMEKKLEKEIESLFKENSEMMTKYARQLNFEKMDKLFNLIQITIAILKFKPEELESIMT